MTRGPHGRWTVLAAVLLLAAPSPPTHAARVRADAAREPANPAPPAPRMTTPGRDQVRAGSAIPDSVLAIVGSGRRITVSALLRAWKQAATPPPSGSLTPQEAHRFLDLLIDREVLGEAATAVRWTWTAEENARWAALRDRLMLSAALDSALAEARAAPAGAGPGADLQSLGIAARDSAVARMNVRFDRELVDRLTQAWTALPRPASGASVAEQLEVLDAMPLVPPADTSGAIAQSRLGDYRVSELLDSWRRLDPIYRPRVESAEQLRDLVRNGLFERALRREAEHQRLDRRADIVAALADERERAAVSRLLQREVLDRIPRDSITLLGFYHRHSERWALPTRVRATRLVLDDRASAGRLALRLRERVQADSLTAQARRVGLNYEVEASLSSDSALFTAALRAGAGTVIGPTPGEAGWWVARVNEVLPGRPRNFAEARDAVEEACYAEEGERLTRALCDRLRKRTRVIVNQRGVGRAIEAAGGSTGCERGVTKGSGAGDGFRSR